jgi:methylthioribose-1-phosphate isomerase
MRVYLAGGINGLADSQCKDWREYAKTRLPDTIDPMRRDYRGREAECVREIVELDVEDIRASRAVLANCATPSWGTAMEIYIAWNNGKAIHVVVPAGNPVSPWLRYHTDGVHTTLDAAIDALLAG